MSPPEQTFNALMKFLTASTWNESCSVVNAHPELLNVGIDMIDIMLKDPDLTSMVYPGRSRSEAEATLRKHKAVLARCQQIGIARTFAQLSEERQSAIRERAIRESGHSPRRRRIVLIGAASLAVIAAVTVSVVLLTRPGPPGSVSYIAIGPNDSLIEATPSGHVNIWNIASKHIAATFADPHTQGIDGIALSQDGREMAIADNNGGAYIWNVATRRLITNLDEGKYEGDDVTLSADGKTLAEYDANDQIFMWDVASRSVVATLHALPLNSNNSYDIDSIALSPDGKSLAVSLVGNGLHPQRPGVELWDVAKRRVAAELSSDYGGGQVSFSRDGLTLVAANFGTFTLWADARDSLRKNMTLNDPLPSRSTYTSLGNGSAVYSPDGNTLATADGSPTNSAFLWSLGTGHITATLTEPNSKGVVSLAYTSDGKTLITADGNGNIYLWDIAASSISATLASPKP
jgi:WD40 repeat protein